MSGAAAARRPWRCETIEVRGLRTNLRKWGPDDGKPLLLVHGTQDSSITFQFLVDSLQGDWCVVAPDLRGHGHTSWAPQAYWFHEFVADLDALTEALFPDRKIPLVGHSLGGNIAGIFAGLRSERLTHVISLDGMGPLTHQIPVDMNRTLRRLLAERNPQREHPPYADIDEMAERLMRSNRRLDRAKALFLAEHSSVGDAQGRRWRFDPAYQGSLPTFHSVEEWGQIWRGIDVPALWIVSGDERPHAAASSPQELARRSAMIKGLKVIRVPDTGHNLHHDRPATVAKLVEDFIEGAAIRMDESADTLAQR